MNKTPEEKFDESIWKVLQKIKLTRFQSKYNIALIRWHVDHDNEVENNIISQLEYEENVIKVIKDPIEWITDFQIKQIDIPNLVNPIHISDISYYRQSSSSFSNIIFLEILSKFNEFYQIYKKKIELIEKDKLFFSKSGAVVFRCDGCEYKAKFDPITNMYKALFLLVSNQPSITSFDALDSSLERRKLNTYPTEESRARQVIRDIKRKLKYKGKKLFYTKFGFRVIPEVTIISGNI